MGLGDIPQVGAVMCVVYGPVSYPWVIRASPFRCFWLEGVDEIFVDKSASFVMSDPDILMKWYCGCHGSDRPLVHFIGLEISAVSLRCASPCSFQIGLCGYHRNWSIGLVPLSCDNIGFLVCKCSCLCHIWHYISSVICQMRLILSESMSFTNVDFSNMLFILDEAKHACTSD